jgi:hypothetical protein
MYYTSKQQIVHIAISLCSRVQTILYTYINIQIAKDAIDRKSAFHEDKYSSERVCGKDQKALVDLVADGAFGLFGQHASRDNNGV